MLHMWHIFESIKKPASLQHDMPFILSHAHSVDAALKKLHIFRPRQTDLAIIGALLPDLEYTGLLPHAHERCLEFYEYLLTADRSYAPVALGMVGHVIYDRLIEPGYVAEKEAEALQILQEFYPLSTKIKWAAHTFVEQAMDTHVLQENPHLPRVLARANKRLHEGHIARIAQHLSAFFGGDQKQLVDALHTIRAFDLSTITNPQSISKLWLRCMFMMSNEHILQEHTKGPLARLKAVIRLGVSYSRFRMTHRLWHMFSHAKTRFHDHGPLRKKAINTLATELQKLTRSL